MENVKVIITIYNGAGVNMGEYGMTETDPTKALIEAIKKYDIDLCDGDTIKIEEV